MEGWSCAGRDDMEGGGLPPKLDDTVEVVEVEGVCMNVPFWALSSDCCCKALVVVCPNYPHPVHLPLPGQSFVVPLTVIHDDGKQSDRGRMEVELYQDLIDRIGPFAALVYGIEGIARSLHR